MRFDPLVCQLHAEVIYASAERFLSEYYPTPILPVPIEKIIECDLGITIQPIVGLVKRFKREGGLSQDMQVIYVDNDRMKYNRTRYRFTLGHELGHFLLHRSYITALQIRDREEWKQRTLLSDPLADSRLERQANIMAASILVPSSMLRIVWDQAHYHSHISGWDLDELGDYCLLKMIEWTADQFQVSTEALRICLKRDRLL